MTSNHQITTEKAVSVAENTKGDVTIDCDKAVIRMSSYADGIGWFVQKTITVDANMLDLLADQFAVARGQIRRDGDEILSADLLEF